MANVRHDIRSHLGQPTEVLRRLLEVQEAPVDEAGVALGAAHRDVQVRNQNLRGRYELRDVRLIDGLLPSHVALSRVSSGIMECGAKMSSTMSFIIWWCRTRALFLSQDKGVSYKVLSLFSVRVRFTDTAHGTYM